MNHIPPNRADHLVYFNPGDLEYPVGLNVLANVPQDARHLVASGVVAAFKGIWRDSWGPRLEYILYNAVAALLDCRNATLLGVNRILTDDRFRAKVIHQINDPFIRAFWAEEYDSYDDRFKREAILFSFVESQIHDVAPGAYIARQTGAVLTGLDGKPLELENWLMRPAYRAAYIVSADEDLHAEFLTLAPKSKV